jgi:SOS response regulatory protein OraA/RecX
MMPLQLLRILPSRRINNRVWLIFSDSLKLPFFIDDVFILGLKTNLEISKDLFEKIKTASLYYLLYNYSLNQIALSPKISQTLSPKIKQKLYFYLRKYKLDGDFSFLVDQIITKLSSQGLLDEIAFSNYLLRKNKKHSRQYLSRLFSFYHLDFPQDYQNNDIQKIKGLLIKKKYLSLNLLENSVKNKLYASLIRKGFAYSDIKTAIDELNKNR